MRFLVFDFDSVPVGYSVSLTTKSVSKSSSLFYLCYSFAQYSCMCLPSI